MVPDPLPLAYAVYAFINVDNCELNGDHLLRESGYESTRFICEVLFLYNLVQADRYFSRGYNRVQADQRFSMYSSHGMLFIWEVKVLHDNMLSS